MSHILDIKVNWKKSIPYFLDAIIEIGLGVTFLITNRDDPLLYWLGLFLILFGVVQLVRKIKTFHISKSHLIVKRPLLPLKITEVSFELQKIKLVELKKIVRLGPHIKIIGKINGKDGGFMLTLDKRTIDLFEKELKGLGVAVKRKDI
ncbi:hypothetical protein [Flagellimonas sp. 2504JD4-2]